MKTGQHNSRQTSQNLLKNAVAEKGALLLDDVCF
jgi:hypothetical protein